jgi:hypothetical protein
LVLASIAHTLFGLGLSALSFILGNLLKLSQSSGNFRRVNQASVTKLIIVICGKKTFARLTLSFFANHFVSPIDGISLGYLFFSCQLPTASGAVYLIRQLAFKAVVTPLTVFHPAAPEI